MNVLRNIKCFNELSTAVNCVGFSSKLFVKSYCQNLERNRKTLFFNEKVQSLLRSLTRLDYEKIFQPKKLGKRVKVPELKFMTDAEVAQAREKAHEVAEKKLQMPPLLPPRQEIDHVFVKDNNLKGYSGDSFVFTDITYGTNDRTRHIVVRDVDGTLRKAFWKERELCNEIYFPREGRKLRTPPMFKPGLFEDVLEKGFYHFILKRACIQFEPDDPLFISVIQRTFEKIAENMKFQEFESTRFLGPMIYYFTEQKKLAPFLVYCLNYGRLEDILKVIELHNILHPENKCSVSPSSGQELSAVKAFIGEQYPNDANLELALKSFEDYASKPKSQAVI